METNNHPTIGNGKVCYIEIPAVDIDASTSFYQKVFHWNIRKRSNGTVAFDDAVGEVSGTWVLGRKPAQQPGLLVYIMVTDIEAAIKDIVTCGGEITQPIGADAPELTARFLDPAGNLFGVYQEPK